MKNKESFNKKLLVEGNDDQHVIWSLCKKIDLNQNFDVIDCEGFTNIYNQIPLRLKQSEVNTIGIIIDADTSIDQRWESIKNQLLTLDFLIPNSIPKEGLIAHNETKNLKIGVWIMPDNSTEGLLEDFISFLVPVGDKLLPIVDQTLNTIEIQGLNQYPIIHKSKARIHSWLALQSEPGTPLGLSITKRYLTTDNNNCVLFINWLKNLFED